MYSTFASCTCSVIGGQGARSKSFEKKDNSKKNLWRNEVMCIAILLPLTTCPLPL